MFFLIFNNSDSIVKRAKDYNRSSNIVALYIFFILFSTENDLSASQFAIGVATNNLYAMYIFGKIWIICRSTKKLKVVELRQYIWYNISMKTEWANHLERAPPRESGARGCSPPPPLIRAWWYSKPERLKLIVCVILNILRY